MEHPSSGFKQTKRLALCAILAGLSLAVLYLGSLSGIFDLCAVVVGALCTAFVVLEIGGVYPWLTGAVTGVLAVLLLPDKFVALEYIVLGGLYPILKSFLERFGRVFSWILKLIYFNCALTICVLLAMFVLHSQDFVSASWILIYGAGNVFFVVYDIALTSFISVYVLRLRKRLKIRGLK